VLSTTTIYDLNIFLTKIAVLLISLQHIPGSQFYNLAAS